MKMGKTGGYSGPERSKTDLLDPSKLSKTVLLSIITNSCQNFKDVEVSSVFSLCRVHYRVY